VAIRAVGRRGLCAGRQADPVDEHVWRVPTLLGVMAVSAWLLFAAVVMSAVLIRRRPSVSMTLA